jgi:hypothetical protein
MYVAFNTDPISAACDTNRFQLRFAKLCNAALDGFSQVVILHRDLGASNLISSKIKEEEMDCRLFGRPLQPDSG